MSVVLFPEIPEGIEQENKALRAENEELRSLLQQENNGRNYENMIYAARLADCEANIRKLEEENAALKDQIKEKAKLEKTTVEPHIILKRAIAILKYIENKEGLFYIDSASVIQILKEIEAPYRLGDVKNESKAAMDVLNCIVGKGKEYGLKVSKTIKDHPLRQLKIAFLRYEPNSCSISNVIKELIAASKLKGKLEPPKDREPEPWSKNHTQPEPKIPTGDLFDTYAPELKERIIKNEAGTLSFKELWKRNYTG